MGEGGGEGGPDVFDDGIGLLLALALEGGALGEEVEGGGAPFVYGGGWADLL